MIFLNIFNFYFFTKIEKPTQLSGFIFSGQTLYSNVQVINGFFKEDIDITTFGKETYLITISNSSTSITEKLIIE